MKAEYKITITVNVCFDYYPYEKTTSEEVPYIITHDRYEYYDDDHDIELTITPIMLLDMIDFVYADSKKILGLSYEKTRLVDGLENAPYYFKKICAEIFDEENLDNYSNVYDYLISTKECNEKIEKIINDEVGSLGELI